MKLADKALFAGVMGLALGAPAFAQFGYPAQGGAPVFQVNPQLQQAAVNQALVNQAVLNQAAARNAVAAQLGLGGAASLTSSPTSPASVSPAYTYPGTGVPRDGSGYYPPGYSSYYPPPYTYESPVGSYYRGVADLTLAYGKYIQDYQRARLLGEEWERSRLVTRRQVIDEWRYMQSLIPMAEDVRRADWERDLARARKQAPIGEILSGKSLNVLLAQLKGTHGKGSRGPAIPLDEETLLLINVSPVQGKNIGFIKGFIKNGNKLNWPSGLQGEGFAKLREKIGFSLEDAIGRARTNGRVDSATMIELNSSRKGIEDLLDKIGGELTLSEFMEAKRYLSYLGEGIRTLADTDVQNYFNRKYEARGKTVPDLIDYMTKEGLLFVNSTPGAEGPYRTLYTFLAAYEDAVAAGMINR